MDDVSWNADGLVAAIVQDDRTGVVLMLGWMNAEALQKTEQLGEVHFYSRSRRKLWKKGETSGNTLAVRGLRIDCDRDAILVTARPAGPTCHTGASSCFFTPNGAPGSMIDEVEGELMRRQTGPADEKSYTQSLWRKGMSAIAEKIEEEQGELVAALESEGDKEVVHEAADLLFHVMVGLRARNISFRQIQEELGRRLGVSGIEEKAKR